MKKKVSFIEKVKYPFLSFAIPILVMLFLFATIGGLDVEQLSIGDMQAQHIDMLLYFKKILTFDESMFYSITNGLGGDMYSSMAYYMLSPINLIILLFEDAKIMHAIRLIILVKIGLCGLTMYTLLNSKNKNKKVYSLLFALCYALMAFVINNYFCTLWFDGVYLAPLVVMGIDKLINEKKVLFYMVTLALAIFCNFYFGYMICIFSVIYFIYSLLLKYTKEDRKEIVDTTVRFLIASLLAGLSVAVIYVPAILSVLASDRTSIEANETNLIFVLYRMFVGAYKMEDFLSYYHPCIYCGTIVLPLIIYFLFNKKITEKEKVVTFSIILLFIFSILFYQLSYIWHGFSFPIGYNFRFSFLLCLFVLMLAHKQICNMNMVKPTKALKYTMAIFTLLALIFVFKKYSELSGYVTIVLLIIYSILLFSNKKYMKYVLLILVVLELGFNSYKTFYVNNDHYTTRESLETDICHNIPDSTGYRVGGYEYYGTNENIACGYSGTDLFSTTINSRITNFYSKVGLIGGVNMYNDNLDNTPIVYSLLGVKYFYSNKLLNDYEILKELEFNKISDYHLEHIIEQNFIYENKYALNYGFMVSDKGFDIPAEANAFEFQNGLIKGFTGTEDNVLIPLEYENDEKVLDSKYIYVFFYSDINVLKINGDEYAGMEPGHILAFENKYETSKFELEAYNYDGSPAMFDAYYLDMEAFLNAMNILHNNQLENIEVNKNVIKATIDVKQRGLLALSIPYEEGFTLYVDGKERPISILYDFFMSTDLSEGEHTIELVYKPKSFKAGLAISIGAIVLAAVFVLDKDNKILKKIVSLEFEEEVDETEENIIEEEKVEETKTTKTKKKKDDENIE